MKLASRSDRFFGKLRQGAVRSSADHGAPSGVFLPHVVGLRPARQVTGVYARRAVALMEDKKAIRNLPVKDFVRRSMGAASLKDPITILVPRGFPNPALSINANILKKTKKGGWFVAHFDTVSLTARNANG